jgi:hypothetical protein
MENCGGHRGALDSLNAVMKKWPTSAARDEKGMNGENHFAEKDRPHLDQLPNAVRNWATANTKTGGPEQAESKASRPGTGSIDLQTQALNWSTATQTDAERRGEVAGPELTGQAANWGTPRVGKNAGCPDPQATGIECRLEDQSADFPCTLPVSMTGWHGLLLELWTRPECPRLNPVFQWWLLGLPHPMWIYSESGGIALMLWRQQLASDACLIAGLEVWEPKAVQCELF